MKIVERNLQELGKSLFVSLPKEWIKTFNLKKGSKIKMVVTEKGLLTIAPEFVSQDKKKETEIEFDKHFKRRFFREYFNGNEEIIINIKKITENERKDLYLFLKRFITIQIIEENKHKIVLKSFKIEELSIEECLKRLYFLCLGMFEELSSSNNSIIIQETRDNMTRFYYLLVMQIRRFLDEGRFTKENQIPLIRAMDFRMVAEKIQRIGELIENFGEIKNNSIKNLLEKIKEHYEKTVLYFINNNYNKASSLWEKGEELKRIKLLKISGLKENQQKTNLFQILRYVNEIAGLIR
jgi:phosphate uptake regulator